MESSNGIGIDMEHISASADEARIVEALRKARKKVASLEQALYQPIAIVGMACRFPGEIESIEGYWNAILNAEDGISEIPDDRWDVDAFFDSDPGAKGKIATRQGGFVDRLAEFDADFFNLSRKEAESVDPQQRLLLETCWEAQEDACLDFASLDGSQTGVFIGISSNDYMQRLLSRPVTDIDAYMATGNAHSVASGRLSYIMGFNGPSFSMDTACSSSLVATHIACQSLRQMECDSAIVGGVNRILMPDLSVNLSVARMLSPDGRCKAFDASANGFVRSEGCGVVVLKRLADALEAGDRIHAVIRGSAINHDGRSSGLTVPCGPSQESVIKRALRFSGLKTQDIHYIEAHGTGTSLGDPIELGALGQVFGESHTADRPLIVGTVKSNIGHLEAAAGVAGLIKAVLAVKQGEIPANLHFNEPNPHVDWSSLPIRVPRERQAWPSSSGPRRAGVSSFGFSGTNAHLIVEQAPPRPAAENALERPRHILTLSAKQGAALEQLVERYIAYLGSAEAGDWADICYTAQTGRARFRHRLSVVAESHEMAVEQLQAQQRGEAPPGMAQGVAAVTAPKVAFLFTGQGSQYAGMGQTLYQTQPQFRRTLDRCAVLLSEHCERPLTEMLWGEASDLLNETRYTQPALFALEYALAELWKAWGITPSVVMGHSVGEYVAACVAGVFSLEDGLKLVTARARLMDEQTLPGRMLAVLSPWEGLEPHLKAHASEVAVAAENGPSHWVVSGTLEGIGSLERALEAAGIAVQLLAVSHAFHSPQMAPMCEAFGEVARTVNYRPAQVKVISNVSGEMGGEALASAAYWVEHIRAPVRFAQGMKSVAGEADICLEIGPQPVLLGMGQRCVGEGELDAWLPSLRKGEDVWERLLKSVGELYVRGVSFDGVGFDAGYVRHRQALPTYPFQRQRYWIEGDRVGRQGTAIEAAPSGQPPVWQDWLYEVDWEEKIGSTINASGRRRFLILCDGQQIGNKLASRLESVGHECILVERDTDYACIASGHYRIDPRKREHFATLLESLGSTDFGMPDDVVHLWGLDIYLNSIAVKSSVVTGQSIICESMLYLVQTLASNSISPHLWIVTSGAQAVGKIDVPINVGQATAWGLGRVITVEYPKIKTALLDLDPLNYDSAERTLFDELTETEYEGQLAFREEKRYVPKLLTAEYKPALQKPVIDDGSSYLVTGGLGALGLVTAESLALQGARHLILVGRRAPSRETAGRINALEKQGVCVYVRQADVSDRESVVKLLKDIDKMPALAGIVHAAGVLDDGMIEQQKWCNFEKVFAPKLAGAWNLHVLTRDKPLKFFICFSSMASIIGSPGQGAYAASNAFMDALAHHRQALGLPALSVNWGPWSGIGMAADLDVSGHARISSHGIETLPADEALQSLWGLINSQVSQAVIMDVDWRKFLNYLPRGFDSALFSRIQSDIAENVSQLADKNDIEKILSSSPEERIKLIISYLKKIFARILGSSAVDELNENGVIKEMGLDSLMTFDLLHSIERDFGVELGVEVLDSDIDISALASRMDSLLSPVVFQDDRQNHMELVQTRQRL